MLDPAYFQDKLPTLQDALRRRGSGAELTSELTGLSSRRKELIQETEKLKALRNSTSQEIAQLKSKAKGDPAAAATADRKVVEMRAVGDQIKALDEQLKQVEEKVQDLSLRVPNIPHVSVPSGTGAEGN